MKIEKDGVIGVGHNSQDGYFVMYKNKETVKGISNKDAKALIMWFKARWYDDILKGMPVEKDKWGLSYPK